MHFGEFLVQQKVLSAHQVLKGLAAQHARRSFIPLLLVDMGAIADYRALRYCTLADQNQGEFLDVLLTEKVISKQQYDQIRTAWMHSGPPLGLLLVELGFMNQDTLAITLEEFEREKDFLEIDAVYAD